MPRNLSSAAKSYTGPVVWLAEITPRAGTAQHFATDAVTWQGNVYLPFLRIESGVRQTRALRPATAEIELLTADPAVAQLVRDQELEGAACELSQLLIGIEERVLLLRGRLTEQEESDAGAVFRLVSELDAAQMDLPLRRYSQLCSWRFSRPVPPAAGPDRITPCGYNPVNAADVTETAFGERTATTFSASTIADSTLTATVNAHAGQVVVITNGPGRGELRRIRSNTATVFTLYHPWGTLPDGTSKFRVFELSQGAPRLLLTSSSGKLESVPSAADARSLTDATLAMTTGEHAGQFLYIVSGAGAGQLRRVASNTATAFTLEAGEPDFNPVPAVTDTYRILHASCSKDFAPSCEERARPQAFNGFSTLVPVVQRSFQTNFLPRGFDPDTGTRVPFLPELL